MKRIILILVLVLFSCNKDENTSTHEMYTYSYKTSELALLKLINIYRGECSLNSLSVSQHIAKLCQDHNFYMIKTHSISHDYFTFRSDNIQCVLHATMVGENIAYNYVNVQSTLTAWKNSPGHDENLKGDFNIAGVSIEEDSIHRKYVTLILAKI
jgi:uncharacterized protein YkwD